MKKLSKLIQDLKFTQIKEVVEQSQSVKPVKISKSTKRILQKYFGRKFPNQYLIDQGAEKLRGYYIPDLKIAINSDVCIGGGSYGTYYKISPKEGIKVIDNKFRTLSDLKNSKIWKEAYQELLIQRKVALVKSFVPKAYKLVPLYDMKFGWWRVGIIMDHVNAKTGYNLPLVFKRIKKFTLGNKTIYCKSIYQIEQEIKQELKTAGIIHKDLHCNNFLIKNKDIKVIDFGKAHLIKKD